MGENKDEINADTFRCTKCIENDRRINVHLRKQMLDQYIETMARSIKIRARNNSIKRTIQDSSPKKKGKMENMSKKKKQRTMNICKITVIYWKLKYLKHVLAVKRITN